LTEQSIAAYRGSTKMLEFGSRPAEWVRNEPTGRASMGDLLFKRVALVAIGAAALWAALLVLLAEADHFLALGHF
jgi:hypothetical protein